MMRALVVLGELLELLAISVSWKFEIRTQEILARRIFSLTVRNFLIILRNACFEIHVCGVEATVRSLDVPNFAKCAFNVTSCHSSVKSNLLSDYVDRQMIDKFSVIVCSRIFCNSLVITIIDGPGIVVE